MSAPDDQLRQLDDRAAGAATDLHARAAARPVPTFDPEAYYNAVKKAPAHSTRGAKLDRILQTLGK